MARSKSVIEVSIIGDAKKLIGAVGDADKASGGLLKSAAKIGGAAIAVDKVFDVINDSLGKADDFNDAFAVLSKTIGKVDADKIKDMAFDMTNIGLSADEVGVLATSFANFATAAGVAAPTISALTPDLLDIAAAVHAQTGKSLDEIVSDIGKAAGGSKKPVQDLGVVIDKSLNPDEQLRSILDQLKAKYGDAKTAADDLRGTQDKINANVDNFQIKLGAALEGPLNGIALVGLEILDELKDWPGAIGQIGDAFGKLLSPLARIRDIIDDIVNGDHTVAFTVVGPGGRAPRGSPGSGSTDRDTDAQVTRNRERNGLGA